MKKAAVLSLILVTTPLFGFHTIGNQPFCNIDPKEQIIACNYESAQACLSNLEDGQHCIGNHDYIGDLPSQPISNAYSSSPEIITHLAASQQKPPLNLRNILLAPCHLAVDYFLRFCYRFKSLLGV